MLFQYTCKTEKNIIISIYCTWIHGHAPHRSIQLYFSSILQLDTDGNRGILLVCCWNPAVFPLISWLYESVTYWCPKQLTGRDCSDQQQAAASLLLAIFVGLIMASIRAAHACSNLQATKSDSQFKLRLATATVLVLVYLSTFNTAIGVFEIMYR